MGHHEDLGVDSQDDQDRKYLAVKQAQERRPTNDRRRSEAINAHLLERWGVTWPETGKLLLQPIPDGYWTPWHLAEEQAAALRQQLAELQRERDSARKLHDGALELYQRTVGELKAAEQQLAEMRGKIKEAETKACDRHYWRAKVTVL